MSKQLAEINKTIMTKHSKTLTHAWFFFKISNWWPCSDLLVMNQGIHKHHLVSFSELIGIVLLLANIFVFWYTPSVFGQLLLFFR
jgi:hypothetical protein